MSADNVCRTCLPSRKRRPGAGLKVSRVLSIPVLLAFVFLVQGFGSSVSEDKAVLHYRPPGGWLGDVHPLFYGNEWHLYCLEVPSEPLRNGLFHFHSVEIASRDLIHWDRKIVTTSDPCTSWWLIANIIRDGTFYTFYNGHQGIWLSTSGDFRTWSPYPKNPVLLYPPERIRDPFIFYDDLEDHFLMVLTARKRDFPHRYYSGAFYYSTSTDLLHWSPPDVLYDPGAINEPECPDLFKLDNHYYLLGSWGTDRWGRGRYRIADCPQGPWRKARTESLDGQDLVVPNTASDSKRRMLFGWIPTYRGNEDFGKPEWGGHLAFPREIWAEPDGTLYSRLPKEFLSLRDSVLYPRQEIKLERTIGEEWIEGGNGLSLPPGSDYGEIWLPGEYSRMEMRAILSLSQDCSNAGFLFRCGGESFVGYEVAIDRTHQQILLRHHLERDRYLGSQTIQIKPNTPMELRVFVDGNIVECFLDDRFSLVGRAHLISGGRKIGFYSDGGGFNVSEIQVFKLREIYTDPGPRAITLRPLPDPLRSEGGSALFPSPYSAIYTNFDSALNFDKGFSLECWLKPTEGTGGFKRNILVKGDKGMGYHYGLNLLADNSLEFYFKTMSGYAGLKSLPDAFKEEGQWFHVAAAFDSGIGEIRLYKNGERIAVTQGVSEQPDTSNQGALRLGYASGFPQQDAYLGLIDEVRIWKTARSDKEIKKFHDRSLPPTEHKNVVVYWTFDEEMKEPSEGNSITYSPNRVRQYASIRAGCFDGAELFAENCFRQSDH